MRRLFGVLLIVPFCAACRLTPTYCAQNIVSATVLATYCSHASGAGDALDLFVLWRGTPEWFSGKTGGTSGGQATPTLFFKGWVYSYKTYGRITIGVNLDFARNSGTVLDKEFSLSSTNVVLVDGVDEPPGMSIVGTKWIAPQVESGGDPNLILIRRSPELAAYLRCEVPLTPRPAPPSVRPAVITVCEKLNVK